MHNLIHVGSDIDRQSSVKIPPTKNTSSNNTLHIFHPFFTLPIITLAIVKIEQKAIQIQNLVKSPKKGHVV